LGEHSEGKKIFLMPSKNFWILWWSEKCEISKCCVHKQSSSLFSAKSEHGSQKYRTAFIVQAKLERSAFENNADNFTAELGLIENKLTENILCFNYQVGFTN
jgi:hypothetical protein